MPEPLILAKADPPSAWAYTYRGAVAFVSGYGTSEAAFDKAVEILSSVVGKKVHRGLVEIYPLHWDGIWTGAAFGQPR